MESSVSGLGSSEYYGRKRSRSEFEGENQTGQSMATVNREEVTDDQLLTLQSLPVEIIFEIGKHLGCGDFMRFRQTCRLVYDKTNFPIEMFIKYITQLGSSMTRYQAKAIRIPPFVQDFDGLTNSVAPQIQRITPIRSGQCTVIRSQLNLFLFNQPEIIHVVSPESVIRDCVVKNLTPTEVTTMLREAFELHLTQDKEYFVSAVTQIESLYTHDFQLLGRRFEHIVARLSHSKCTPQNKQWALQVLVDAIKGGISVRDAGG